jgi:hypothetical protein
MMGGEFWAAISGAIVGALIAGVISYCLQRQSLNAAEAQRNKDILERKQTLARSFVVRLSTLYSHLSQMDRHMKAVFAFIADHPDPKPEAWQVARPVSPLPSLIYFPTDELTLLLTLKLDNLFNDAAMLDEVHNTAVAIFGEYGKRKEELNSLVTPVGFTGDVAHLALTPDQVRIARPKMVECSQLAEAMRDQTERGARESWALLTSVSDAFNEKLQLALQVNQLQPPPGPVRI